jgi:hypothetical protein
VTKFSQWLTSQVEKRDGIKVVESELKSAKHRLSSWMTGASTPNVEGQLALADALGCEFAEIRELLDFPSSDFMEWLCRKIIAHGTFRNFCLKAEISRTFMVAWLNRGTLPDRWRLRGGEIAICNALIEMGDTSDRDVLLGEINALLDGECYPEKLAIPENKVSPLRHFAKVV